jgi:hypothetical protein
LIIYYFLAVVVLAVSFTIIYFISNPLDRSNSTVIYPYAIGIKPTTISENGSVAITLSNLDSQPKNQTDDAITLYVVDPVGNGFNYTVGVIDKVKTLQFNASSISKSKLEKGQYSVLLVSNRGVQNKSMSPVHFDVVFNPSISSFSNFAFGAGLAVTIGLIISIVTTLYEFISTRHNQANLKLYEHSKWTLEKSKYYMDLVASSKRVCELFEMTDTKTEKKALQRWSISFRHTKDYKYDKTRFLHSIVRFYASVVSFRKAVNVYYFDDVLSEDFLSKLEIEILTQYDDLVDGEVSDLKKFLNLEMYQLMTNKEFAVYSDCAYKKLQASKGPDDKELSLKERLCFYHFAYYKVLYTSVNDAFIVTYSSPALLHKSVSNSISGEENLLEYVIDYLNHNFYQEKS